MSEGDWRARKRDATRQRLLDAAFGLFAARGYDATSVGDVAAAAGVSVPTFYEYFPNKEHVVLPAQDEQWLSALLAAQPADLPLSERIRGGLQAMVAGLTEDGRDELLLRWRLVLTVPVLRRRAMERENASGAVLVDALGVDLSTSDGAAAVVVLSACLNASTTSLLRWAATGGDRPLEELMDEAFEALRSI